MSRALVRMRKFCGIQNTSRVIMYSENHVCIYIIKVCYIMVAIAVSKFIIIPITIVYFIYDNILLYTEQCMCHVE